MLPSQNIPESQKDAQWAKKCVQAIVWASLGSRNELYKDKFCYDLYNGIFNQSDFDYLRKVDEYEYPAKIRFIPLLRPKMDLLKGDELKRPLNFRVFTCDTMSLQSKEDLKVKRYMKLVKTSLDSKRLEIQGLMQQYSEAQALIQQAEQAAAQDQQERMVEGQISPPPPRAPQEIKDQLELAMSDAAMEQLINANDIVAVDKFFKYDYKDFLEQTTEQGLKYIIQKYGIKDIMSLGFEDKLVTDKEIYFVDYAEGDEDPKLRRVSPLNFYYSTDDEVDWIGECQWAMEERYLNLNQIVDEFKGDLDSLDMQKLNDLAQNMGYSDNWNAGVYDNSTDECETSYAGNTDYANKVRVCYVTWKSTRAIKFKKSKNKYGGKDFTKWLAGDDKPKSTDTVDVKYVNDVWEGVQIAEDIMIRLRKKPYQLRSIDKYGKVDLPYVGIAFNYVTRKPYSIVWAAKDIQILYNIIHYHKELWLSLSGVKGFIMDKSQLPEGMSMREWIYQRKIGIGWIESVKEGMARQPTFNQFQTYDDTVTPAIQYLVSILQHLEELASQITGVSRQRQGTIVPTDQVGTTEQSIGQSALVTEIIFHEHEKTKSKALTRLVNLCKIAWKKGKRGSYVLGDLGQEILNIPGKKISSADYEVFVGDGGRTERAIRDLKQMAAQEYGKGMMSMSEIIKIYDVDNIKELEKSLEYYSEIANQRQQQAAQGEQQAKAEAQKQEQDFKAMIANQENQFKQMAHQLEIAKFEWDKQKFQAEEQGKMALDQASNETNLQGHQMDNTTDLEQTNIDAQVEMAYLEQKRQEAMSDHKLKAMELAMSASESGDSESAPKKKGGKKISNPKSTGGFGGKQKIKD
jgi:hypothetical protein